MKLVAFVVVVLLLFLAVAACSSSERELRSSKGDVAEIVADYFAPGFREVDFAVGC